MSFTNPNTTMQLKTMRRKSKRELLGLINSHKIKSDTVIQDENYYDKQTLCDILNFILLRKDVVVKKTKPVCHICGLWSCDGYCSH